MDMGKMYATVFAALLWIGPGATLDVPSAPTSLAASGFGAGASALRREAAGSRARDGVEASQEDTTVEAALRRTAEAFRAAATSLDAERFLSLFASPDRLEFIRDGQRVTGLHEEVRATYAGLSAMECEWTGDTVEALSPDAGIIHLVFRCAGRTNTGQTFEGGGAWTILVEKEGSEWRITHAHESHSPPEVPSRGDRAPARR